MTSIEVFNGCMIFDRCKDCSHYASIEPYVKICDARFTEFDAGKCLTFVKKEGEKMTWPDDYSERPDGDGLDRHDSTLLPLLLGRCSDEELKMVIKVAHKMLNCREFSHPGFGTGNKYFLMTLKEMLQGRKEGD